ESPPPKKFRSSRRSASPSFTRRWSSTRRDMIGPLLKYFDGLPLILVRLEANHHRLGFRILLQHFVTHFAAPAGLFVTAKRQSGIKYVVTIDPDRAGSQFGRNPVRFGDVTGPDACRKAVFGLVRARN